ncbi:MAG: hypothetical protein HYT39_01610 [Candidatus Sungbacteria bacterium]|nr:hypothetical protein [Candidatus Sungbacteria bacterium]
MPKVSQNQLSREMEHQIADALVRTLAKINDEKPLRRFLDNLLTHTEKIMLAKRLMVAVLLQHGYSYGAICRVLKISKTTVHIIQRELFKSGEGYRKVFSQFFKESQGQQVIKAVERILGASAQIRS